MGEYEYMYSMVVLLDGNTSSEAQVLSKICNLSRSRHLFTSNLEFGIIVKKRPGFPHTIIALRDALPSDTSTMRYKYDFISGKLKIL